MPEFSGSYTSLDPDPLKRGKQFERFVKWFLKADPEWATQVDQVWLWDEWPGRWNVKQGPILFRCSGVCGHVARQKIQKLFQHRVILGLAGCARQHRYHQMPLMASPVI